MTDRKASLLTSCAIRGHYLELRDILDAHESTLPLLVLMPLREAISSLRQASFAFAGELKTGNDNEPIH